MNHPTMRQLKILALSTGDGISAEYMATYYQMSDRSVKREIAALRELGAVFESVRKVVDGDTGYYFVLQNRKTMKPLIESFYKISEYCKGGNAG